MGFKFIFVMKSYYFLLFVLLFISIVNTTETFAQKPSPNIDMGLGLDGNAYLGDLNLRAWQPQRVGLGYSFAARFSKKQRFFSQFQIGKINVTEQSSQKQVLNIQNIYEPTYFFSTNIFYASYQIEYFFLKKYLFSPYVKAGFGLSRFTPFDKEGNNLSVNTFSRKIDENFSNLTYFIPIGAGLQYKIGAKCFLTLDYTYHILGTDYMDNIGQAGKETGKDAFQSLRCGIMLRIAQGQANEPYAFPIATSDSLPTAPSIARKDSLIPLSLNEATNEFTTVESSKNRKKRAKDSIKDAKENAKLLVLEMKMKEAKQKDSLETAKYGIQLKPSLTSNPTIATSPNASNTKPLVQSNHSPISPKESNRIPSSPNLHANNVTSLVVVGNRSLAYNTPILRLNRYPIAPDVSLLDRNAKIKKAIPARKFFFYEVQSTDTWESVAKAFNIPIELLKSCNLFPNDSLDEGMKIRIPEVKE